MRLVLIAALFIMGICGVFYFLTRSVGEERLEAWGGDEVIVSESKTEASREAVMPDDSSTTGKAANPVETPADQPTKSAGPCRLWFEILNQKSEPARGVTLRFGRGAKGQVTRKGPGGATSNAKEFPPEDWSGRTVTTDEQGRLDLSNLIAGEYLLYGESEAGILIWRGAIEEPKPDAPQLSRPRLLRFTSGRRITVCVVDQEGEPVANCLVGFSAPDDETGTSHSEMQTNLGAAFANAKTDAKGKATVIVERSVIYRTIFEAEEIDVFVPRFGGELLRQRFRAKGRRLFFTITVPRPATARIFSETKHSAGTYVVGGGRPWRPSRIRFSHSSPRLRLDGFAGHANSWRVLAPGDGAAVEVANFEPGGEVSLTSVSRKAGYPHLVLKVPPLAAPFDIDVSSATTSLRKNESDGPMAFLELRVQLTDGSPVDTSSFRGIWLRSKRSQWLRVIVKEGGKDGRLKLKVPAQQSAELIVGDPFGGDQHDSGAHRNPRAQTRSFSPLAANESLDLGTLTFEPAAILVTGRLVNGEGEPCARQTVSVRAPRRTDSRSFASPFRAHAETDADGRFKILGRYPVGSSLRLKAYSVGAHASLQIAAGDRDVTLVAEPHARLFGWIQVEDGEILRGLTLKLVHDERGDETHVSLNGNGSFVAQRLSPGQHTISAKVGHQAVIAKQKIEILPGTDARPAALQGWDFLGEWMMNEARVVDADGEPIEGLNVMCRFEIPEGSVLKSARTSGKGLARFLVPRRTPVNLRISAGGASRVKGRRLRSRSLKGVTLPMTIWMEGQARSSLRFANLWPDDTPDVMRIANLLQDRPEGPWRLGRIHYVSANSEAMKFDGNFSSASKFRIVLIGPRQRGEHRWRGAIPEHLVLHEAAGGDEGDLSIDIEASDALREKVRNFLRDHYPGQ